MISNTVLNGSWWFYPSPLDFLAIVFVTLFTEIIIICTICYLVKVEENKIPSILIGVIIANIISAIIGYIVLFSGSGGW